MYGIIGLLLLLVAVLTIEVYRATEGFTNATPATLATMPTSVATPATTATPATPATLATSNMDALALDTQDRAKFLRDIQDIVRTELLATKQITTANSQPILSATATPTATAVGQISEHQGREAVTAREKACAKDMSQYIRKDSIPCWNCSLDY
jgi:hypothetical protein